MDSLKQTTNHKPGDLLMFYDVFSNKEILGYIQSYKGDRYIIQWNDGTSSSTFVQNVESYKRLLNVTLGKA